MCKYFVHVSHAHLRLNQHNILHACRTNMYQLPCKISWQTDDTSLHSTASKLIKMWYFAIMTNFVHVSRAHLRSDQHNILYACRTSIYQLPCKISWQTDDISLHSTASKLRKMWYFAIMTNFVHVSRAHLRSDQHNILHACRTSMYQLPCKISWQTDDTSLHSTASKLIKMWYFAIMTNLMTSSGNDDGIEIFFQIALNTCEAIIFFT